MLEAGEHLSDCKMESLTIYSIEEQLEQLDKIVSTMEKELDHRYDEFRVISDRSRGKWKNIYLQINTNDMKQRMTGLERVMMMCRDDIRKDCQRGAL